MHRPQRLIILGSTGSIGQNALQVIRAHPGRWRVAGLAAARNVAALLEQAQEFRPEALALLDPPSVSPARRYRFFCGPEGASELVESLEADLVLVAMSTSEALLPVLKALQTGKDVALANKECLVAAGRIITQSAARAGRRLIPVDSEHSALFQLLENRSMEEVASVMLTASGGALRDLPPHRRYHVTAEEVLKHPTWKMGPKVTVDSASLMNKALEIIEAHWLFNLPAEKIRVLLHRQSIVHALVEFTDGTWVGHLALPDMRLPIQFALAYPERVAGPFPRLKLSEVRSLSFEELRAPAIELAYTALRAGGTAPAVLNAANEQAVAAFLAGKIPFGAIYRICRDTLAQSDFIPDSSLEAILREEARARRAAQSLIDRESRYQTPDGPTREEARS